MAREHPAGQGRRVKPVPATEVNASQWRSAHTHLCAGAMERTTLSLDRGMDKLTFWKPLREAVSAYRFQLRFSLRMTAAGLVALLVAQSLALPLHGLWVVLTAVVVTQMSVGGSLRATIEYIIGTLGGAVYAGAIGVLVPHAGAIAQGGVLALTIAPLAFAAAINPNFRVAPFSAVLVLLLSGQLGEGSGRVGVYSISRGCAWRCNRDSRFAACILAKSSWPGSGDGRANFAAYGPRLPRIIGGFHGTARCKQNTSVTR
jgi:uncharacterized membrane protein YccC